LSIRKAIQRLFGLKPSKPVRKKYVTKKHVTKTKPERTTIKWNLNKERRRFIKKLYSEGNSMATIFSELKKKYPNQYGSLQYGLKTKDKIDSRISLVCNQTIDGKHYKTPEKDRRRINSKSSLTPESTESEIDSWRSRIVSRHRYELPNNHNVDKICPACFPNSRLLSNSTAYEAYQEYLKIIKQKTKQNLNNVRDDVKSTKKRFDEQGNYVSIKERQKKIDSVYRDY
jgi:hypothetical protein